MKIKWLKNILISSIIVALISSNTLAAKDTRPIENIKKFNTEESVYLNGSPIEVPSKIEEKDEEFRGVWVSTIYNLDFPSKPGLSKEAYKKEYIKLLEEVEKLNLNSIIFQVRPKGDAFYESDINPWSENLTGREGVDPGWDPLEWMILETHKKGLEFQAWFNPYRVTVSYDEKTSKEEQLNKLSDKNWAKNNPDDVFKYKGKLYLNPGSPKVMDYINDSIMEVVYKYDIDGVHLDDYFYPNKPIEQSEEFYSKEEVITYNKYGLGFDKVSDWRRDNIDKLILKLSESISTYNKNNQDSIQFGISPFGIWGHKVNHPKGSIEGEGSNTPKSSQASYDNQFANTRKWVKEQWIDYIAPQVYWTFDQVAAPYGELVHWWADVVKDTEVDLYIGHALYKKAESDGKNSWSNPKEISNQLKFNSLYEEVKGDIYFRYKNLLKSDNEVNNQFIDILKNEHYKNKVKLPAIKGNAVTELKKPYELSVNPTIMGNNLTWKDYKDSSSIYYLLYREEIRNGEYIDKKLVGNIKRKNKENFLSFLDDTVDPYKNYRYSVSAVNKLHEESGLSY